MNYLGIAKAVLAHMISLKKMLKYLYYGEIISNNILTENGCARCNNCRIKAVRNTPGYEHIPFRRLLSFSQKLMHICAVIFK